MKSVYSFLFILISGLSTYLQADEDPSINQYIQETEGNGVRKPDNTFDDNARRPSDNQKPLNPGQQMQRELQEERRKNFKSLKDDEAEYYKYASPKSSNASDYFKKGHPMKPSPLKSNPLR